MGIAEFLVHLLQALLLNQQRGEYFALAQETAVHILEQARNQVLAAPLGQGAHGVEIDGIGLMAVIEQAIGERLGCRNDLSLMATAIVADRVINP